MENICLDTDILVDFLRNKKEALSFFQFHEHDLLATTPINLFELYYGAFRSYLQEQNISLLEKLKNRLLLLPLSKESAQESARILVQLEKQGIPLEFKDLLIGATALTHNFSLKTNNLKHFNKIPNLKLV